MYNKEQLEGMEKEQLIDIILVLMAPKDNRKAQVLEALKEGPKTVLEIAEQLNTTAKNVSSYLTYLRKDGVEIFTDTKGRKFINE